MHDRKEKTHGKKKKSQKFRDWPAGSNAKVGAKKRGLEEGGRERKHAKQSPNRRGEACVVSTKKFSGEHERREEATGKK